MHALGVSDFRFLGGAGRWRDSGMSGVDGNDDPRAFWRCARDPAAFDAAVDHAVTVIRHVRPQVLVTYDENGGYGHPDHIMAHRIAMAAVERAAATGGPGDPWSVAKVYWSAVPMSVLRRSVELLREAGDTTFYGVESAEELPFGVPDEDVTTVVDGSAFGSHKQAAMRAYPTQIAVDGPFFALSNNIGLELSAVEYYRLVRGELGDDRDADGRETDLFAGVA
jgi:N-acetyl-1-D-myo-inositol-2-amino-2-deoxy-alpha-D-glucopyranoside deacetylase